MDDSAIMHDKIIEETKAIPTNHNEKNITFKIRNFCIWLAFLLIALHCTALLIAVSLYCYLKKYQARQKQKYLLAFNGTNNELKQVLYW